MDLAVTDLENWLETLGPEGVQSVLKLSGFDFDFDFDSVAVEEEVSADKTYVILENPEPMSIADIKEKYRGYWVYLVNAVVTSEHGVLGGTPVIIGKRAYDGASDGIYNRYDSDDYVKRVGMSLLLNPTSEYIKNLGGNENG